jgi:hypothetical protein
MLHGLQQANCRLAAVTVMMAVVAMLMMVVVVSDRYDYLRARWDQRHEERQGENSKCNLLHTHGMPPLFINQQSCNSLPGAQVKKATQLKLP